MIFAGYVLPAGWPRVAAALILLGGLCDVLDGELARITSQASERGAFIDSICDHLGDFAVYLGLAARSLSSQTTFVLVLLLASCFGSIFGSLLRARAGLLGIDLKDIGFATRFERLAILLLATPPRLVVPALWGLAMITNLSALQRLWSVLFSGPAQDLKVQMRP
jgi:phosphatidylglycerophosphate synthase